MIRHVEEEMYAGSKKICRIIFEDKLDNTKVVLPDKEFQPKI